MVKMAAPLTYFPMYLLFNVGTNQWFTFSPAKQDGDTFSYSAASFLPLQLHWEHGSGVQSDYRNY